MNLEPKIEFYQLIQKKYIPDHMTSCDFILDMVALS